MLQISQCSIRRLRGLYKPRNREDADSDADRLPATSCRPLERRMRMMSRPRLMSPRCAASTTAPPPPGSGTCSTVSVPAVLPAGAIQTPTSWFWVVPYRTRGMPGASSTRHEILDLGAAWFELTNLPFVFAVWALRRGVENAELRQQLRDARDFGVDTLDWIIRNRTDYDYDFRKDYFDWHIHYHLATDEKRAIAKFAELLRKHGLGPVFEPKFVT